VFAGEPRPLGAVSLRSHGGGGHIVIRGTRGMLAFGTVIDFLFNPPPRNTHHDSNTSLVVGVRVMMGGTPACRGFGFCEAVREGLRTDPGPRYTLHHLDSDDVGVDFQPDPAFGSTCSPKGSLCGDGSDLRLLEAVILPARATR